MIKLETEYPPEDVLDDDEEVLRLRELRVGDPRDAQARDDDGYDLQENYLSSVR